MSLNIDSMCETGSPDESLVISLRRFAAEEAVGPTTLA